MQHTGVDVRGLIVAVCGVLLFAVCSGGRHMPTNQQDHDILAATAAFTTKFNAANAMVGARKRTRDQVEEFCSPWPSPPPQQQQQQFVINATSQLDTHPGAVVNPATTANNVSTGLRLTFEDDTRLRSVSPPPPEPTWAEDFATYMQKEREDIAQLLKVQVLPYFPSQCRLRSSHKCAPIREAERIFLKCSRDVRGI